VLDVRRVVVAVGVVLFVLGVGALVWSYLLAHGAHALAQGWWEGTLQAMGVGFVVGGLVDVLAVTGLNRIVSADDRRRQQLNERARLVVQAEYRDEDTRREALDAFLEEHQAEIEDLAPDARKAIVSVASLVRVLEKKLAARKPPQASAGS